MTFQVNPLSLCLPQQAFETWLRESGQLEVLDKNALDQALLGGSESLSAVLIKALKINPLRSLTIEDFCNSPVSWTGEFFDCGLGPRETYSYPRSLIQAKLRMEDNVKRYTGNYLVLALIIFLCFLYKMPLAFLGILSCLALWDTLRVYINSRGLRLDSFQCRCLQLFGNLATMFVLVYCKAAVAVTLAGLTSLLVVILHSALRRITALKNSPRAVQ
ncbi:unnamed protein product [Calypogeia fissa]